MQSQFVVDVAVIMQRESSMAVGGGVLVVLAAEMRCRSESVHLDVESRFSGEFG